MSFIILSTISLQLFTVSKGRKIAAFAMQQQVPLVKESLVEMTPTVSKFADEIANEIKNNTK